jgi:hypothetical protein
MYPEVFQTYFDQIQSYIKEHFTVRYLVRGTSHSISTHLDWNNPEEQTSVIARRLAAIYFPLTSGNVAHCYEPIANADRKVEGTTGQTTQPDS